MDKALKEPDRHERQPEETGDTCPSDDRYPEPESQGPKDKDAIHGKPKGQMISSQSDKVAATDGAASNNSDATAGTTDDNVSVTEGLDGGGSMAPLNENNPTASSLALDSRMSYQSSTPESLEAVPLGVSDVSRSPDSFSRSSVTSLNLTDTMLHRPMSEVDLRQGLISLSSESCTRQSRQSLPKSQPVVDRLKIILPNDAVVKLLRLQGTVGAFSYYIVRGNKLVVHAEDDIARQDLEKLKAAVHDTIMPCGFIDTINVTVKPLSFRGSFCRGNRVGATLMVNGQPQTVGMYVRQGGLIYYMSTAHNYEPVEGLVGPPAASITAQGQNVRLPAPLVSFAPDQARCKGGHWLLHHVDLMIGLTPLLAPQVEAGQPAYTEALQTMRDLCHDCKSDECSDDQHVHSKCYVIESIHRMASIRGGEPTDNGEPHSTLRYDATHLYDKILRCLPCYQPTVTAAIRSTCRVLAGKVVSYDTSIVLREDPTPHRQYNALNVLLIMPQIDGLVPERGDSGSVWVGEFDGRVQAVAITIGRGEFVDENDLPRPVWLAALLQPSLDAFWQQHKANFPTPGDFVPVRAPGPQPVSAHSPQTTTGVIRSTCDPMPVRVPGPQSVAADSPQTTTDVIQSTGDFMPVRAPGPQPVSAHTPQTTTGMIQSSMLAESGYGPSLAEQADTP